jgi:hypothetical protein
MNVVEVRLEKCCKFIWSARVLIATFRLHFIGLRLETVPGIFRVDAAKLGCGFPSVVWLVCLVYLKCKWSTAP